MMKRMTEKEHPAGSTIEGAPGINESDNEFTFYFKTEKRSTQKRIWNSSPINSNKYCFNNKGRDADRYSGSD